MQRIFTSAAPGPAGHYSQAVQSGDLLFVSGQLPLEPDTREIPAAGFEAEARQALTNVRTIVEAAGGTLENVLKVTLYIADIADWPRANEIYADFFGAHRPARSVLPVGRMHLNARIVVEAIARVPTPSADAGLGSSGTSAARTPE
jgi:2-iminobutanoate/2-iminopropanoate deaminase